VALAQNHTNGFDPGNVIGTVPRCWKSAVLALVGYKGKNIKWIN